MKYVFTLLTMMFLGHVHAQEARSPFRKGYMRLGINNVGEQLDLNIAPKANILASRYGAGTGYVFETGRVYYFNMPKKETFIGYGLDWTIVSLTYNPLSKWKDYASSQNRPDAVGSPFIATLSTRLGPVISIRPVESLIIDLRGQLAAGAHYYDFYYNTDIYSFTLQNGVKGEQGGSFTDHVVFGLKPSFGISVRRKVIGLAVDYAPGEIEMNYEEVAGDTYSYKSAKIRTGNLQLKLSFTF